MSEKANYPDCSERFRGCTRRAAIDAIIKLDPRTLIGNPVMFTVEVGSAITTLLYLQALLGHGEATGRVYRRDLRMALVHSPLCKLCRGACGRPGQGTGGIPQEDAAGHDRKTTSSTGTGSQKAASRRIQTSSMCPHSVLHKSDLFYVKAGDTIPVDGEILEGIASVNESAITGESAPVIREAGGDRSAVTGGTVILSDWLIVRVSANPGEGFLDHMISLIEGAKRQKTPNEIALNILLLGLTTIFIVVAAALYAFSAYSVQAVGAGTTVTITVLVALFVCLAPTTIGGLLSAIGIAGMDRLIQRNVITTSGRAIEAAGDVDVLLLDKTGTITLGNRQAVEFIPVDGTTSRGPCRDRPAGIAC